MGVMLMKLIPFGSKCCCPCFTFCICETCMQKHKHVINGKLWFSRSSIWLIGDSKSLLSKPLADTWHSCRWVFHLWCQHSALLSDIVMRHVCSRLFRAFEMTSLQKVDITWVVIEETVILNFFFLHYSMLNRSKGIEHHITMQLISSGFETSELTLNLFFLSWTVKGPFEPLVKHWSSQLTCNERHVGLSLHGSPRCDEVALGACNHGSSVPGLGGQRDEQLIWLSDNLSATGLPPE